MTQEKDQEKFSPEMGSRQDLTPEELELLARGAELQQQAKIDAAAKIQREKKVATISIDLAAPGSLEALFNSNENWSQVTSAHRMLQVTMEVNSVPVTGVMYATERYGEANQEVATQLGETMTELMKSSGAIPYLVFNEVGPSLGFLQDMKMFASTPEIKTMTETMNGKSGWSITINTYNKVIRMTISMLGHLTGARQRVFDNFDDAQKFLLELVS